MTIKSDVKKTKRKYKFALPKGQYLRKYAEYDPSMCAAAYEILSNGGTMNGVKGALQVCNNTFAKWMLDEDKISFRESIRAGMAQSKIWHEEYMKRNLDNRNYNERAHGRYLRLAFNFTEDALAPLPELKEASDNVQRTQVVINAIADGKITPKQGSDIGLSILNDVKAEESTKLKDDIEELKALVSKGK